MNQSMRELKNLRQYPRGMRKRVLRRNKQLKLSMLHAKTKPSYTFDGDVDTGVYFDIAAGIWKASEK